MTSEISSLKPIHSFITYNIEKYTSYLGIDCIKMKMRKIVLKFSLSNNVLLNVFITNTRALYRSS